MNRGERGGKEGKDALRLATAYPIRWLLCILRKGEAGRLRGEGRSGGKENGGMKSIWVRLARGRDAHGVQRGGIFPPFFTDSPFALPAIPL